MLTPSSSSFFLKSVWRFAKNVTVRSLKFRNVPIYNKIKKKIKLVCSVREIEKKDFF